MKTILVTELIILLIILIGYIIMKKTAAKNYIKTGEGLAVWLLTAVTKAEQLFGSKTGKLKLQWVYSIFREQLPELAETISYEEFCKLVDKAIERMEMLAMMDKEQE